MRPVRFPEVNRTLVGTPGSGVDDLPTFAYEYGDGTPAVTSCWEMSDSELAEIVKTRRVWITFVGAQTHPPVAPSAIQPYDTLYPNDPRLG